MTNWKLRETIDKAILVLAAVSLFFPEGVFIIPALTEKVANFVEWRILLAGAVSYTLYSYNQIVRV